MDQNQLGLLEPLLPVHGSDAAERSKQVSQLAADDQSRWQSAKSFLDCTFNLAKVITGAGMMAIPRAYTQIGSLLGTGMLLGVAVLTYWTMAILVKGSSTPGAQTYPQLVSVTLGPSVAKLLQVAVLCFCAGFNVVYLVVIKDILLGTPPHCNGLLCELFGVANSGPWANPAYIICCVALACAPLLLLKSMDKLSLFNIVGVAATVLLATAAAGLGAISVLQGTAHPIPLLPQWQSLGPTTAAQLEALTDVLPVILACYVAHQSLHPLMPLLKPYSSARMCGVVAAALALVACIFLMLSVGGALAFGPDLDINALKNFTQAGMAPFVGGGLARILSWAIRGGYLIALLANLLLYMHPLRSYTAEILWPEYTSQTAVSDLGQHQQGISSSTAANPVDPYQQAADTSTGVACICCQGSAASAGGVKSSADGLVVFESGVDAGSAGAIADADGQHLSPAADVSKPPAVPEQLMRWQRNEQRWYYPMTYGLLVLLTLLATCVPDIWLALSAIGDLATTVQAFVIPGLIALALAAAHRRQQQQHIACRRVIVRNAETPRAEYNITLQGHTPVGNEASTESAQRSASAWSKLGLTMESVDIAVYSVGGWFVLLLGSALFVNGVWQRV